MKITYDTCVVIAHRPEARFSAHFFSAVVIQELIAGSVDDSEAKYWIAVARESARVQRLLVPDAEDWIQCGRVLNSILRGLKSRQGGKTPRLSHQEKDRIIRDVLIARTVRRAGGVLVTDNIKDFRLIRRFCAVNVKSSRELFGS